jgi:Mn2+/Fe2+ NRAMP family transporter
LLWLGAGSGIAERGEVDVSRSLPYRAYLVFLATVPLVLLRWPVQQLQLAFGITGVTLLPLLALTLLMMNNRREWVGDFRTGVLINVVLGVALLFFVYVGAREVLQILYGA